MLAKHSTIEWKESMNEFAIDCSLAIAIHPAESSVILLTIPGVDGSLDGYEDKYVTIAETAQERFGVAVVRMENPFISSYHWESNARHILEFINDNTKAIAGTDDLELRIMAHSAGASIIAQIAWEYPNISRLLLINPAARLGGSKIKQGLKNFKGDKVTILVGSEDPSKDEAMQFVPEGAEDHMSVIVAEGADHHFADDAFPVFLEAPHTYLFD